MSRNATGQFTRALRWWAQGLSACLPRRWTTRDPRGDRRLVLSLAGDGPEIRIERRRRSTPLAAAAGDDADAIIARFAREARRRSGVRAGVRLAARDSFRRRIDLPEASDADLARMVALDLERSSPFKAGAVYAAHTVGEAAPSPGRVVVDQHIVKRQTLEPILTGLRRHGVMPQFADIATDDGASGLPIDLLAADRNTPPPTMRRPLLAAALVLMTLAAAAWIDHTRQQDALERLGRAVAEARTAAAAVRTSLDRSDRAIADVQALAALHATRLPLAALIDELSHVLPDDTWLTGLRFDGTAIEMTGYTVSAAGLIPLIEASAYFSDATLSAPVTFEANERKERFAIRMQVERREEKPDRRRAATADAAAAARSPGEVRP